MAGFGFYLLLIFALSACGGGSSSGGGTAGTGTNLAPGSSSSGSNSSGGTSTPGIASVMPADKDSCVAASDKVIVNFSTAMNPTAVQAAFHVSGGAGNIAGTVVYANQTATFTPQTPLTANTTYTATLDASATDTQGNRLGTSTSWTFTTVPAAASGNYVLCWNPVSDARLAQYHLYWDTVPVTSGAAHQATVTAGTNGVVPHTYEVGPTTLGTIGSTVYIAVSAESTDASVNSVLSDSITVQVQ